ncbi:uncharacterized protein LOC144153878 [Haemaphysalis longicornis]
MAGKQDSDSLETIKAVIRALLIADKRPLTLRQFLWVYRQNEGQELPFEQHGFSDPASFLRSLPDAVRLTEAEKPNEFYVNPTLTAEVRHVRSLVSRQKNSAPLLSHPPATSKPPSCSSRPPPVPRTSTRPRQPPPPQPYMVPEPPAPRTSTRPRQPPPPQPSVVPEPPAPRTSTKPRQPPQSQASVVPEQMKGNLRQVLADYRVYGINVLQLEEVYASKFGTRLDYEAFGYNTIEDFVVSMPDVFCATRSSVGIMRAFLNTRDSSQRPGGGPMHGGGQEYFAQASTSAPRPGHQIPPVPKSARSSWRLTKPQPRGRAPNLCFRRTPATSASRNAEPTGRKNGLSSATRNAWDASN